MFFETNDFSINSISAFSLKWGEKTESSDIRPYHALSFRVRGDAEFIHNKDIVKVKTGDIVFVPSYYHYTIASGEEEVFVIHFTTEEKMPPKIKKFTPEAVSYYEKRFTELYNVWSKKQVGFEHECKSIFYKIITHIERDYETNRLNRSNSQILQAIEHIHENFTDPQLTVSNLAKDCNMSETYFRKLFLKNCGTTPLDYINNLRLTYAIELLKSNYYTVNEVSEKCGFSTPYYFSAFIKKQTGKSPISFRNTN